MELYILRDSSTWRNSLPRTENDKRYLLNIPFDFLSMLVGLIDGDGYISITQTPGGFIRIQLILSKNIWDKIRLSTFNPT